MRCLVPVALFVSSLVMLPAQQAAAKPTLALRALFSDHMVLPQQTMVLMRGLAEPNAHVLVRAPWTAEPFEGIAAASGVFMVGVMTPEAGGPFELAVVSGTEKLILRDVLVGDVWLGSGQSNMEMPVGKTDNWQGGVKDWQQECAASDLPEMRLFTVARRTSAVVLDDVAGHWEVCTKESSQRFSATALFFGRELLRQRRQPLGLVVSSWGGTVCEAWTSANGLQSLPEFAPSIEQLTAAADDQRPLQERAAAFWQAVALRDSPNGAVRPEAILFDDHEWQSVAMPHLWSKSGLGGFDGVGFYRTQCMVPEAFAGKELVLSLGAIDDMDTVWFQGERIGGMESAGQWQTARRYTIPGRLVRAGNAVLAVRVLDTGGEGGFATDAEAMRMFPVGGEAGSIGLAKQWRFQLGAAMRDLPSMPSSDQFGPNTPTVLWQAMIAPLLPFPFRGAIWYQGESNRERAAQYAKLFPAMINDWRAAIGFPLPFYFVQIAPFGYGGDTGELFDLRQAQAAALLLPETGMAVTTDVGDVRDIHPIDKQTVGLRLARLALRYTYGDETMDADAPKPLGVEVIGRRLRVRFSTAPGAMRAGKDGPHHFEIAGVDGVYHAATARVIGQAVVLEAAAVTMPRAVRYCFAATAMGDLWSSSGCAVAPFVFKVAAR